MAKAVQNLANLNEFGTKEAFMAVVNSFIISNKQKMVEFLDNLSVSLIQLHVFGLCLKVDTLYCFNITMDNVDGHIVNV